VEESDSAVSGMGPPYGRRCRPRSQSPRIGAITLRTSIGSKYRVVQTGNAADRDLRPVYGSDNTMAGYGAVQTRDAADRVTAESDVGNARGS